MKKLVLSIILVAAMIAFPNMGFAKAPTLGTTADFVLFSSNGAVSNIGISQLTGNVGTNNGASTAFGNVNGVMHDNDGVSALCSTDLLGLCLELDNAIPTMFPAPLMGGDTLQAGIYSLSAVTSLNDTLTLDAKGNSKAVFIFKIGAAFSTGANAYVRLANGAMANNVFWKVEGLVSLATKSTMRGTIIANNSAILMSTGVVLEGRALSTAGAVTVDGVLAYTPVEADKPLKTGPAAPALGTTACYALFSTNGETTNAGVSYITGDAGTNVGLTTGFDTSVVVGAIHPIPDVSTAACAADLLNVYNYLNLLPYDIELLYPAQFGSNLVLTPHTYWMNSATTFTDSLYLNAEGNPDAVFVIKINGALETSTFAKVLLINGTQAKNVYWKIDGAVQINDYSQFKGTIVANNGAININKGTVLEGRALTTDGALKTAAVTVTITAGCVPTNLVTTKAADITVFSPSPRTIAMVIKSDNSTDMQGSQLKIYNLMGRMIQTKTLTDSSTTFETTLPAGVYFYRLMIKNGEVLTGKLISK